MIIPFKLISLSKQGRNYAQKAPLPAILHTALSATFDGLRVPERDLGLPWIGVLGLDIADSVMWQQLHRLLSQKEQVLLTRANLGFGITSDDQKFPHANKIIKGAYVSYWWHFKDNKRALDSKCSTIPRCANPTNKVKQLQGTKLKI